MASSNADDHDVDKLTRWRKGIAEAERSIFPVYAIFLVGPEDLTAHDVFREFRASFEARNAPYENLVIFGQHGVSKTSLGLRAGLGLSQDEVPLLVLFSSPATGTIYTMPLEAGIPHEGTKKSEPWRGVLRLIEAASDPAGKSLDLELEEEVTPRSIRGGSLEAVINRLLLRLAARS